MSVIGLKVGPFEIVGPAFVPEPGAWYLARRAGTTRKQPESVLVRVLSPDAPADERVAVQRQYEALKSIEDNRIPQAVGYFEGLGALAIDASSGAPLLDAVRIGVTVSRATLLDLLLEVAETLQRVHHRHRYHGHLDPGQIVLTPEGAVVIFGFGAPDAAPDPRWIPPERAAGEDASPLTDQWSLGLVALLLAPGAPPPASAPEPLGPRLEALAREWPALGRLVRRMLDPHPGNRFPSLHPVRQELLALARELDGTSDRRALARRLARERVVPPADPPSEPTTEATVPPASPAPPAPDPEPPPTPAPTTTPLATDPTPRATPRRNERLPAEEIPIVRPDVSGEIPLATLGRPDLLDDPDSEDGDDSVEPDPATQDPSTTGPTAVPLTATDDDPTDHGNPPMTIEPKHPRASEPPSVAEAWFDPTTEPGPEPSLGLSGVPAELPPTSEPALAPAEDEPDEVPTVRAVAQPSARPFPIQRVAPVLALLFAALTALWLATRFL